MGVSKKHIDQFLNIEMTDLELVKLKTSQPPRQGTSLRIDLQVDADHVRTPPPRNIWGIQVNLNAKVKALSNFSSRPSKNGPGNTKSMNVELQIEVTEDAAQHLTPDIIRSAFRMSLCDDLGYTAVHKVLVEEEYVKQKDKNGKDIEILTAVPRVEPHPEWLQKFSEGPRKDEISNRNPPAPLNRATPKAATKAREAREAAAKQQNQAPPNIRGGKPGMGQGGKGGRGRGLGRGGGFAGVARGGA